MAQSDAVGHVANRMPTALPFGDFALLPLDLRYNEVVIGILLLKSVARICGR
jgi:hypothetical protein